LDVASSVCSGVTNFEFDMLGNFWRPSRCGLWLVVSTYLCITKKKAHSKNRKKIIKSSLDERNILEL
jgi:hypothetical protein